MERPVSVDVCSSANVGMGVKALGTPDEGETGPRTLSVSVTAAWSECVVRLGNGWLCAGYGGTRRHGEGCC